MDITLFRVDDRLIHGQIVTSWLQNSGADQIVVADDLAGNDPFQQSLLAMAVPPGVKLTVLPVADAVSTFLSDISNVKVLLLTRNLQAALQIVEGGVPITEINVGNLNMKPGKTKILNEMWLDQGDVDTINALADKGVVLEQRVIPSDRRQNAVELAARYKG